MEKAIFRALCLSFLIFSLNVNSQDGETINGQLLYHGLYPFAGVTVNLHNASGNILNVTATNASGNYAFYDITPGNYSISFSKIGPVSGVTLTDAFLVMMHLFNLYPFTPIQHLAADVDGNGTITWNDYFLILIGYLNQGNTFPVGEWVFEEVPPFTTGSRDQIISSGNGSGDVNGTFIPTKAVETILPDSPDNAMTVAPGDKFEITVKAADHLQIGGLHLAFHIPEGLHITHITSPLTKFNDHINQDELKLTWLDETLEGVIMGPGTPIFTLTALIEGNSPETSYNPVILTESHFIDNGGNAMPGVNILVPAIKLALQDEVSFTVYPNPFMDYATFRYEVPADAHVSIKLYNQYGVLVLDLENSLLFAGHHQTRFDGSSLSPGIYYYRLSMIGDVVINKSGSIVKPK